MEELLKAKSEFRKKGVVLVADKIKQGGGGAWKFASEDALIKTIQKPLTECGLELITIMDYNETAKADMVKVYLMHNKSGKSISSQITLPSVEPRKDKNGNAMYLDAEIERGKQFGYWARTLAIRLLGLSDIDPEDVNNRPLDMSGDLEEKRKELDNLMNKVEDEEKFKDWVFSTYKVEDFNELSIAQLNQLLTLMKQKAQK